MVVIEKPYWVGHNIESESGATQQSAPIFSVHVHPDGTRFATAGQDNTCKIWAIAPLLDVSESEKPVSEPERPRILAVLSHHTSSVNCVRWSYSGKFLASSSDDTFVMLWELQPGMPSTTPFGSTPSGACLENWNRVLCFRGHTSDVVDLAWAPRDDMLASCSVDNTVRVWRVSMHSQQTHLPECLAVLTGHSGMVKGVAWDPMGKLLASKGDDGRLVITGTHDWSTVATITAPFEAAPECPSFFQRPAFSSDGMFLAATNAVRAFLQLSWGGSPLPPFHFFL